MSSSCCGRSKPFLICPYVICAADFLIAATQTTGHRAPCLSRSSWSRSTQGHRSWGTPLVVSLPLTLRMQGMRHIFKAPQLISTSFCRAQAKPLKCVVIDSPDARRHRSVAAHIPVAFFLIWIISVLVSEHHSSFPFLQAFTQHSEHTEGRSQPMNARNTKITWQVACIGWTFCRRNVQTQLLRFA